VKQLLRHPVVGGGRGEVCFSMSNTAPWSSLPAGAEQERRHNHSDCCRQKLWAGPSTSPSQAGGGSGCRTLSWPPLHDPRVGPTCPCCPQLVHRCCNLEEGVWVGPNQHICV